MDEETLRKQAHCWPHDWPGGKSGKEPCRECGYVGVDIAGIHDVSRGAVRELLRRLPKYHVADEDTDLIRTLDRPQGMILTPPTTCGTIASECPTEATSRGFTDERTRHNNVDQDPAFTAAYVGQWQAFGQAAGGEERSKTSIFSDTSGSQSSGTRRG